jgi:short-subunit dehydrogenase
MKIVITGASSGLGAALAQAYAEKGSQLYLTGRDSTRLEAVATQCRQKGAEVTTAALDVTNRDMLGSWLRGLGVVDLLIANAGISAGTGGDGESEEQARRIFDVNLYGVLNSIHPLLPDRVKHIAIISSLAGLRGQPGAPAYSASKGAVRMYGESLRMELAARGIGVTVVCPGFIRTPGAQVC